MMYVMTTTWTYLFNGCFLLHRSIDHLSHQSGNVIFSGNCQVVMGDSGFFYILFVQKVGVQLA